MAKNVGQVIVEFGEAVIEATVASAKATLNLPHNIIAAIEDAKRSAELERQMDEALIDPTLLDRIMAGEK